MKIFRVSILIFSLILCKFIVKNKRKLNEYNLKLLEDELTYKNKLRYFLINDNRLTNLKILKNLQVWNNKFQNSEELYEMYTRNNYIFKINDIMEKYNKNIKNIYLNNNEKTDINEYKTNAYIKLYQNYGSNDDSNDDSNDHSNDHSNDQSNENSNDLNTQKNNEFLDDIFYYYFKIILYEVEIKNLYYLPFDIKKLENMNDLYLDNEFFDLIKESYANYEAIKMINNEMEIIKKRIKTEIEEQNELIVIKH